MESALKFYQYNGLQKPLQKSSVYFCFRFVHSINGDVAQIMDTF